MGRIIDASFSGLSSPRRSFSVGRPEIAAEDRPGAALLALVASMTRNGDFNYRGDDDPGLSDWGAVSTSAPSPSRSPPVRFLDDERTLDA